MGLRITASRAVWGALLLGKRATSLRRVQAPPREIGSVGPAQGRRMPERYRKDEQGPSPAANLTGKNSKVSNINTFGKDIDCIVVRLIDGVRGEDNLSPSIWIALYTPLFILLFIIIPRKREMDKAAFMRIKKRKGAITMTNEVIKKYIGKKCKISTGSLGTNVVGIIIDLNENWIEVETKKGKELINAEFIQIITVKEL